MSGKNHLIIDWTPIQINTAHLYTLFRTQEIVNNCKNAGQQDKICCKVY